MKSFGLGDDPDWRHKIIYAAIVVAIACVMVAAYDACDRAIGDGLFLRLMESE